MNKQFRGMVYACLFSWVLAAPVNAAIISTNSIIEAVQLGDFGNVADFEVTRSTGSDLTHTYNSINGSVGNVKGSFASGAVGSSVFSADNAEGQSLIAMYDTLSFSGLSGATSIDYSLHLDGQLSVSNVLDDAFSQTFVKIYDITGVTNWLEENQFINFWTDINPVAAATEISSVQIFKTTSTLGTGLHVIDETAFGSFTAQAGKTYGIQITSNSRSTGENNFSDFLNTSTFGFTNLNGATFTSGSGAFLSAAAPVPEPSILALFGIGLLGFIGSAGRKAPHLLTT